MGTAVSLLLIAVGAIMRFAVTATGSGWNVHTTGVILMIIGGIGLVLSIIFWGSWGGFNSRSRTTTVVRSEDPPAAVR